MTQNSMSSGTVAVGSSKKKTRRKATGASGSATTMSGTTLEPENLGTPGDDATPQSARKHPTKGNRYRVMGNGEGDYCIYQIAPQDSNLPAGCLIPIPNVPRFESTAECKRWIKADSGDLLARMQVMLVQVMDIGGVNVENRPQVTINWKPKIRISGPEHVDG